MTLVSGTDMLEKERETVAELKGALVQQSMAHLTLTTENAMMRSQTTAYEKTDGHDEQAEREMNEVREVIESLWGGNCITRYRS